MLTPKQQLQRKNAGLANTRAHESTPDYFKRIGAMGGRPRTLTYSELIATPDKKREEGVLPGSLRELLALYKKQGLQGA